MRPVQLGFPPFDYRDDVTIFRIKVVDWLAEVQRADTVSFSDREGREDEEPWERKRRLQREEKARPLSPESIRKKVALVGTAPILWLDEIDKYVPTVTRTNYLLRLVDSVYELNGTIIASANLTMLDLEQHMGEAMFRRVKGSYEEEGIYTTMDLFDLASRDKRSRR